MPCPICLKDITLGEGSPVVLTRCNHVFHVECLDTWLTRGHTCPMCRFELISRPASPTSVLDFVDFEPLEDSPIIGMFLPNYDLGQRLDYGEL